MSATIRLAVSEDAAACLAIYTPIVERTPISFELHPPTVAEMRERVGKALAHSLWIVAEDGRGVAGYAYGSQFRARAAYDWTVETTVYVDERCRRGGIGRRLHEVLLGGLRIQGFRTAMAGITLPNEASVRLHEATGFAPVGRVSDAGYKFGRWHDIGFWQAPLGEGRAPERTLTSAGLVGTAGWRELARAE